MPAAGAAARTASTADLRSAASRQTRSASKTAIGLRQTTWRGNLARAGTAPWHTTGSSPRRTARAPPGRGTPPHRAPMCEEAETRGPISHATAWPRTRGRARQPRRPWLGRSSLTRGGALLVHPVEPEAFAFMHQGQQVRGRIGGIFVGEQHVDVIESARPLFPVGLLLVMVLDRQRELLERRWRAVFAIDLPGILRAYVHDLLARHRERGRDQRRALDHGEAGGVD